MFKAFSDLSFTSSFYIQIRNTGAHLVLEKKNATIFLSPMKRKSWRYRSKVVHTVDLRMRNAFQQDNLIQ